MITELIAIKLIAFPCPPESSAVKVGLGFFWLEIMVSVLPLGADVSQHLRSGSGIQSFHTIIFQFAVNFYSN